MLVMFRKVNAKERVVGFYSTGPQIRPNDLRIYDIVERYTGNTMTPAVFCIIDVRPNRPDLPVTTYRVTEEVSTFASGSSSNSTNTTSTSGDKSGSRQVQRTFAHVHSSLGAMEAEEVGVEHLLRDINDPTVSTVASLIKGKQSGLVTLGEKLIECKMYLEACARGDCQVNGEIIANLQTIISLLPNLNNHQLIRSMMLKTNDMYMSIYLAALIRSVIALHDVVNNKMQYGEDGTEYKDEEEKMNSTSKSTSKGLTEEEKKDDKGDINNNTNIAKKGDSSEKK
jgi:26S proteasome regulatory subunit N8